VSSCAVRVFSKTESATSHLRNVQAPSWNVPLLIGPQQHKRDQRVRSQVRLRGVCSRATVHAHNPAMSSGRVHIRAGPSKEEPVPSAWAAKMEEDRVRACGRGSTEA